MDNKPNSTILYANTQLQPLVEHLFAVGYVAEQLHKRLMPSQEKQSVAIFVAGCLHDLGKIDPRFQDWVKNPKKKDFVAEDGQHIDDTKFSFDKHPRHNEISVLLYHLLDHISLKKINSNNKQSIKHVLYWHHAKPFRKEKEKDFVNYGDIYKKLSSHFNDLMEKSIHLLDALSTVDAHYRHSESSIISSVFSKEFDLDILTQQGELPLPYYKKYAYEENVDQYRTQIQHNADNNIMRACVIAADRWVSALHPDVLHAHIKHHTLDSLILDTLESPLCSYIQDCLRHFPSSERSSKQSEIAKLLIKTQDVAVLAGPAGCGKTKIALEWALLKNAQKIIWICPRVQVCQGLFHELTSEQYLPNANIEINTGEFKFTNQWNKPTLEGNYFSGDIVITTIDQVFGSIITHSKANGLIDYLNSHIVFDEFHEYINMPAFNLLFAELIACKQNQESRANTLLVSATPHYFYLQWVLNIDSEDIVSMTSFNESRYKIEFKVFDEAAQDEHNPLYQRYDSKTFVISNTALTAQKSFIKNQQQENTVLLHSKFKKSDKQKWFEAVYESFKKDGTNKFTVLRSGPIVQASLNISCDFMVTELTNAEDCLQRLGRLDRFGLNKGTNVYCIAIPKAIDEGKGTSSAVRFLSRLYTLGSTKAWYQFIKSELNDTVFTLPEIYALYQRYHASDNTRKWIESDLITSLKASVTLINLKVIDPITISSQKTQTKGNIKISKQSLRGDNRFVQMAVCDVNDPTHISFLSEYAYRLPVNDGEDVDNLTASKDEIEGYGDSDKNLLAYMKNKHHNIMGGTKAFKDYILLNEARDSKFPIYLSYTPSDLLAIGGETARHSYAIYYAVCNKQPIGAISMKHLTSQNED
mgnify:CR=1 FL=1